MAEEEYKIKWQAPEYIHTEKGADWYWALSIIGLALIIVSVIMENYLFSILLLISFLAVVLHAQKPPAEINCEINKSGVFIGEKFHSFANLESFKLDTESSDPPRLLIKSRKIFQPLIVLILPNIDPEEVSNYLAYFLTENDLSEPLSHRVMEYLGF